MLARPGRAKQLGRGGQPPTRPLPKRRANLTMEEDRGQAAGIPVPIIDYQDASASEDEDRRATASSAGPRASMIHISLEWFSEMKTIAAR